MSELPQLRIASTPLFILAGALALGILTNRYVPYTSNRILLSFAIIDPCLALLSAWFVSRNRLRAAFIVVAVIFASAGLSLTSLQTRSLTKHRITRLFEQGIITPADPLELTGTIEGQPEHAPQSFYLSFRAERLRLKGNEHYVDGAVLLLARAQDQQVEREYDALELRHGARVRVMTVLDREESFRNPGVLPFTEYLDRKGYDATGVIKSPLLIERLDDEKVFVPLAWLYEWRERLEKAFSSRFSPETAGVLEAALLGNRYNISQGAADRFRAGGTFHVLVISGLHIGFIGAIIFLLARRITKRRFLQFLLSATVLWGYTIAVGAEAPVVRAALMFTLIVFAPIVWRRANTLNVIGGAALVLLVWRPDNVFDPSFQLTFASVLSIVLIAAPLLRRMETIGSWRPTHATPYPPVCGNQFRAFSEILFWRERAWRTEIANSNVRYKLFKAPLASQVEKWHLQGLLRFAVAAIVVSASVQIGMLPILIIYFHRLSFASLFLNIFVGALLAVLAFVALAVIVISQASAWFASLLIVLAEKIDWLMIHLVDPFTRAGIDSMRLPNYSGWKAGLYLTYLGVLLFLIIALALWNPLRLKEAPAKNFDAFGSRKIRLAAVMFMLIFAAIIFHPFSAASADGKLHVDFLDVGQGDCALLTMPDGATLLIDGGGRPNIYEAEPDRNPDEAFERDTRSIGEAVVSEYLWSRGLDRVDYILPTHADADHIDGLNTVARNFKVRGAIVARTPADDPEYGRFARSMKDLGVPIERVGAGDVMRFKDVQADVIWPPANAEANAPYANNDGLVLRVRYGDQSFLFAADIEKQAEAALANQQIDLRSDIVKVAHHGSKTSSTNAFVAATRPKLAVISVGRTSIFGHPNKEVLDRWRASGAQVMTTGEKGTISVVTDGRALSVSTFVK